MPDLFPWSLIKYHSATSIQRNLLSTAGFTPLDLSNFLNEDLLPEIYSSASTNLQSLLLQALDSLGTGSTGPLSQPLQIVVKGRLRRIRTLVDNSSKLMKDLFARGSGYAGFDLLPDGYASGTRLTTLRAHGLAHEDLPDAKLFLACADQFIRLYEGADRSDSMLEHSRMLLDMLRRNIQSYSAAATDWDQTSHEIFTKPFLVSAVVITPYSVQHDPDICLTSLQSSADYAHFRMVGNAVPVTDPTLGDTDWLRLLLGQPTGPQPMHVVNHLLYTARDRNQQLQREQHPPALGKHIREDVNKAYGFIVRTVQQHLRCQWWQITVHQQKEVARLTKKLAQAPWVLVEEAQRFAAPYDLVFDTGDDLDQDIQVPHVLLNLLTADPAVKKWAIDELQITDLQHKAPAVKQLHSNPPQSVQQYLAGSFNNPDAFTDAVVSVTGREVHLHKMVVAKGCELLATRWGPHWKGSQQTLNLDNIMSCAECSIKPCDTALVFFGFFYTSAVAWPKGAPDMASALELLVMACVCNVPFLVCEAEVALRRCVTVENCCKLLEVADHHAAQQLRKFCLHFIANGHKLVTKAEGYASLSPELVKEVEQVRQALQDAA